MGPGNISIIRKVKTKPLTIGITGIFGSGKTTVTGIFAEEGVPVVSCDEIVHRLLEKKSIIGKIRKLFGGGVFEKGRLSRKKLGSAVFHEKVKRELLEKMLHPQVFKEINKKILDCAGKDDIIVIEVPLLFETKSENLFDRTVVVSSDLKKIKRRLKEKLTEAGTEERWNAQMPLGEKEKRADCIIDNSGSLGSTRRQVKLLIKKLKNEIIAG